MTPEEHQARHVTLHQGLDELLADFMRHTPGPWTTQPIDALLTWSYAQRQGPTHAAHVVPLPDAEETPEQLLAAFQSWERRQQFLWTLVGAFREYEASQGRYNGLAILTYSRDLGLGRGWRDQTEA